MLGLGLDLGRIYIAKDETQTFTDAAALAAAMALDGISLAPARNAATANTMNKWNLGTASFTASGNDTDIRVEFARPLTANASAPDDHTWSDTPPTAAGYTFVRVTASANLPLYILPVVGAGRGQTVRAASVAGQVPLNSFAGGLLPFSPIRHAGGFTVGKWYTLRYPGPSSFAATDLCPGDQGDAAFLAAANSQTPGERGYYEDPQEPMLRNAIVDGIFPFPVGFPGKIAMSGGPVSAAQTALNDRINFDSDHTSSTYAQYQANRFNGKRVGNGFRLVGAPINAGPVKGGGARDIVGFGGFFLSASATQVYYPAGEKRAWCAEYYGVWSKAGLSSGPGVAGVAYTSVLVQ
jgi:hypothetical protein